MVSSYTAYPFSRPADSSSLLGHGSPATRPRAQRLRVVTVLIVGVVVNVVSDGASLTLLISAIVNSAFHLYLNPHCINCNHR